MFHNPFKCITITDLRLIEELIHCSYNLTFATRLHHLPIHDKFHLPTDIITSNVFKYFPSYEQEFLHACKASNDVINFSKDYPDNKMIKISTGKEIVIHIYHQNYEPLNCNGNGNNKNSKTKNIEFRISDLSKFTGLCRRYKTPTEVEKIIMTIFKNKNGT